MNNEHTTRASNYELDLSTFSVESPQKLPQYLLVSPVPEQIFKSKRDGTLPTIDFTSNIPDEHLPDILRYSHFQAMKGQSRAGK